MRDGAIRHVALGMLLGSILTEFIAAGPMMRSMTTGDEPLLSGTNKMKNTTTGAASFSHNESAVLW
jgi:hypothetical protein